MSGGRKNGAALYLTIQNDIRKDICEGKLKADDRIPSETELVNHYKVSRVTASKALNDLAELGWIYRIQGNGSFVSKEIDKILQTPELQYSYRVSQDTLEEEIINKPVIEKKLLALIIPTILDNYAQELVYGINEEAAKQGYSLIIRLSSGNREIEKDAINEMREIGVHGILIFPVDHSIYNEEILEMKINRFPFVLIDRNLPGVITNYIMCDNITGAKSAMQHLYELGHRKIAFCSDNNMHVRSVADRYSGFKQQARLYNLPGELVFTEIKLDYSDFTINRDLMECIRNKNATGFFVAESYVCMYINAMIESMGFSVPRDFSLITFDNPMPAWEGMEFFTYINQNSGVAGQEAVKLLCDIINGEKDSSEYYNKMISPKLCIRKSTSESK